jgi:hypothetical protein
MKHKNLRGRFHLEPDASCADSATQFRQGCLENSRTCLRLPGRVLNSRSLERAPLENGWRGARVVEWDGLENRCTRKGTVGSNPTLSARESG